MNLDHGPARVVDANVCQLDCNASLTGPAAVSPLNDLCSCDKERRGS